MRAVFSMMRDEDIFLPLWLKHYTKYFDDVHIITHYVGPTPDHSELHNLYNFTEFFIMADSFHDIDFLKQTVGDYQKKLLETNKIVLMAEADEFIVTDPKYFNNLTEYMDWFEKSDKQWVTCTGYEVLGDEELKLDVTKPLLAQRKYWYLCNPYCKTLMAKEPLEWAHGFHYTEEIKKTQEKYQEEAGEIGLGEYIMSIADPKLYLLHLQKIDWEIYNSRGRFKNNKQQFTLGSKQKTLIPERFKNLL